MADELSGKRIAILATTGVEEIELTEPRDAVTAAGAHTDLVSLAQGEIQATHQDLNRAGTYEVDRVVADASAREYDGLLLPGGALNPDALRQDGNAIAFVREFFDAGKPVGVICHGPWTLIEAAVVAGRTLTSYPSVRTDLLNAGANVVDEEVVTDNGLVSSRGPNDLPAFCRKVVEEFAEGAHEPTVSAVPGAAGPE